MRLVQPPYKIGGETRNIVVGGDRYQSLVRHTLRELLARRRRVFPMETSTYPCLSQTPILHDLSFEPIFGFGLCQSQYRHPISESPECPTLRRCVWAVFGGQYPPKKRIPMTSDTNVIGTV